MNKWLPAIFLITLGIISVTAWLGIINSSPNEILGLTLLLFGITATSKSFSASNRNKMIFSVIIFFVGVIVLVQSKIDIHDERGIVFISILFISGSILILLFIENLKTRSFAYTGLLLMGLSVVSLLFFRPLGLFHFTNKIADIISFLWPAILIVFGLVIFSVRKK